MLHFFSKPPDTTMAAVPVARSDLLCASAGCFARVEKMVTGHFGHKTLRHQDTLGHFGTDLKTFRHRKTWYETLRHECRDEEKPGHFDPGQFRWDTALSVIQLKLRHQFCGAEVSRCRNVLWPKCPAPVKIRSETNTDINVAETRKDRSGFSGSANRIALFPVGPNNSNKGGVGEKMGFCHISAWLL